jgi:YHS domain-containing protein
MKRLFLPLFALALLVIPSLAQAGDTAVNTIAVQGYDVVSYQQGDGVPQKGDQHIVGYHDGATYLFANKDNLKTFDANPAKYVPAYGGYCAYGVTKGKKFIADPLAYRLVDGKLYLNLDKGVQKVWLKDVPGNIETANEKWTEIKGTHASKL